ncbi:cytochrome P450 [Annulohypoxylon truncatum]|uniref:cytochrome P450 n=1 Tax=Annulohypoxylon truncatum TaxID=327061 RepID=UPI002008AE4B|nr:cytochrome P450 [Annulohypoxylon truncatum]KAI1205026.1 cytochrome P450 [Annulohypoxylon truncatum]
MALSFFLESFNLSPTATILITILTLVLTLQHLSQRKLDPREPRVLAPPVPVIGHLLGMALLGGRYIKNLGIRHRELPIFTLPVPGSRIYVVADPSLAAAVQRASKVLSFTPIVPDVTERVLGLDHATMEITRRNLDPAPGDERGFLADIQDMVYAWLGPGSYLEELSLAAAREMRDEISSVPLNPAEPTDLLSWVRHLVTVSTAKYLYGPQNPIAVDPSLETSFWDFDHGLGALLMNILPSITARKAYLGREKLSTALLAYLEAGLHKTGSAIVQQRVEIALGHGWTLPAVAREELSFLFAGIVNATTSTFWILVQLYADPSLLASVREEVQALLENPGLDSSSGQSRLHLTDLRDACPILVAVYRECLRLGSDTYSTRLVKQDHMLANQYFLAKNSVVQIAGGVIHADSRIWGEDVDSFNPKRFLAAQAGDVGEAKGGNGVAAKAKQNNSFHPAAFRAFGGGKTLCPGRHFAMNEILAFVALVVLQFDVKPARGDKIEVPRKNDGVLPVHILEPICPVEVLISRREDSFAWKARNAEFVM